MPLHCPHCRSLVRIAEAMRRYFGMPVRCHECARVFVVPPQSPLYVSVLPADSVRPLDRSVSAARCFHERICRACRRKVGIPRLERPADGPVMRCSHCDAGLITLQNLDASRLLVTMEAGVGDWWVSLEQLRWRDWYNPPSE